MTLRPGNPMARALLVLLLCAVIVDGLALPGMLLLDHVAPVVAVPAVVGVAALALLGAGLLRRGFGYYPAWASQLGGLLLGLLSPMMWFVGGLFLAIWVVAFVLGKRMEPAA